MRKRSIRCDSQLQLLVLDVTSSLFKPGHNSCAIVKRSQSILKEHGVQLMPRYRFLTTAVARRCWINLDRIQDCIGDCSTRHQALSLKKNSRREDAESCGLRSHTACRESRG